MKKLLIASDSFLPRWDGIARFLSELIPRIKDDYEITVVAPDYEGKFQDIEKVKVIRIPLANSQYGDYTPARFEKKTIKKLVEENDVVWSQTIGPIGMLAIHYSHKLQKPTLAYIHCIEWELVPSSLTRNKILKRVISFITKKIVKYFYNKCDLLITPTKEVSMLLGYIGIRTHRVVVYLGIDAAKFVPAVDKAKAKSDINIDPANIIMGFTGRIGREKDLITLYRAFLKLEKKKEKVILLIVGEGIKEEKRLFEAKHNMISTGAVNNVVPYLQAMDIYVLPSLTETTSLSTLEAMSCGIPVIATRVGRVKYYIKEKKNGMFFPFHNSVVLSMKLEQLANNEKLRKDLGKNAREAALNYSWEETVGNIKKILSGYLV